MFETLINRLTGAAPRKSSDPTADKLKHLLAATGVDPGKWGEHLTYALIASASTKPEAEALLSAVRNHSWEELRKLKSWDAKGDNVTAYAIVSSENTDAVLVASSSYELYAKDEVWRIEDISSEEGKRIVNSTSLPEWSSLG
jgi:hypothetical protein